MTIDGEGRKNQCRDSFGAICREKGQQTRGSEVQSHKRQSQAFNAESVNQYWYGDVGREKIAKG